MQKINELQLAKELIKFPSITPNDAGVMRFLEKKLKKMGFKTKILNFKEKNFQPVKNLYARLGKKGPNFCFAGHLDVVPPGNIKDWTVNPFKPSIKKGHLIGRGANDMKGSVAAFVSAVSVFLNNNKSFNGSISLLITGDEEGDAVNGTKKVVDYLKKIKKNKKYFLSKKDQILIDCLKSDGIKIDKKYDDFYETDLSEIPTDIQVMINNNEIGAAILRIVEVIGQDELEKIDDDTISFIVNTLNQLDIDIIRNKILLKVLPLKV